MPESAGVRVRRLGRTLRRAVGRNPTLRGGYRRLRNSYRKLSLETAAWRARIGRKDARDTGVKPENIIWIFGSGRTGSSWLSRIMGSLPDHSRWNEPTLGLLFGHLYYGPGKHRHDKEHFILANQHRDVWIGAARSLSSSIPQAPGFRKGSRVGT